MSKIDWSEAPSDTAVWIESLGTGVNKADSDWHEFIEDGERYQKTNSPFYWKASDENLFFKVYRRTMPESELVGTQRSSQPRYKDDEDGLDHIARFARDNSIEEFRAAMRFTIDKYRDRLGEKDARSKELGKIADYYGRWAEIELGLESKTDGC
tara:strand:+ start:446 stop:907 length:462 start_codon:yes stop_codon:yes gene_type:complete